MDEQKQSLTVARAARWFMHCASEVTKSACSTSQRFRMNVHDWVKAHWATFWGAIGAGLYYLATDAQVYIFPMLRSRGFWGVVGAGVGCCVAQIIISLCSGGKSPPLPPMAPVLPQGEPIIQPPANPPYPPPDVR